MIKYARTVHSCLRPDVSGAPSVHRFGLVCLLSVFVCTSQPLLEDSCRSDQIQICHYQWTSKNLKKHCKILKCATLHIRALLSPTVLDNLNGATGVGLPDVSDLSSLLSGTLQCRRCWILVLKDSRVLSMHIQESYRLAEGIADTSCNISIKVKFINEYFKLSITSSLNPFI